MALQMAPRQKLIEVMKAMLIGEKYSLSFELAGISLIAYMTKRPIDTNMANLKMVPYYVTKKPSEPSLMT